MIVKRLAICILLILFNFNASSQGFDVTAEAILNRKFHPYLEHNAEYLKNLRIYNQHQKSIDSCYVLLEKSSLTIRNAVKKLNYQNRKRVLAIIEAAKNERSGDIYSGFKTFDDPTMNTIKATIRVATIYECEIIILKSRLRKKNIEAWATDLAGVINAYYYPEFVRYELNHELKTYQELLPIEQNIDKVLKRYQQNTSLPIEQDTENFDKLLYLWEVNIRLLRDTDERYELLSYLREMLRN